MDTSVPDKFINRQLNDSRYISRLVKSLLSNIVRCVDENGELEQEATSKKVITCNGVITDRLKHDWGLKDVWNRLMLPRFERLNNILETDEYVAFNSEGHKIPTIPMESRKGFNIKRIDHRHHALDAIVIACTTRSHVQLLNNEAAKSENKEIKYALSHKLRRYEDVVTTRNNVAQTINVAKEFFKPWETFTIDVQSVLQNIVVSFKQNLRVVNKTNNLYQKIDVETKKKVKVEQQGCNLAVRKSLHKETYYGEVNLRKIKTVNLSSAIQQIDRIVNKEFRLKLKELLSLNKNIKEITSYFTEKENSDVWQDINLKAIEVYYYTNETKDRYFASRKSLSTDWTADKIKKEITDTAVQKILLNYLTAKGNDPKIAFTPIGIEELNRDIALYNGGVPHKPIYKVRKYEQADKFKVGENGMAKLKQFVEGAKGTNLYFIVYLVDGERKYKTLPFHMVLAAQKEAVDKKISFCNWEQYLDSFLKEKGYVDNDWEYQFSLSPNDLVYVPALNEIVDENNLDKSRVYKMVSSSGNQCFFVLCTVSKSIVDKKEYSPLNKMENAITGEQIKKVCIPLTIDRLGNIKLKK